MSHSSSVKRSGFSYAFSSYKPVLQTDDYMMIRTTTRGAPVSGPRVTSRK